MIVDNEASSTKAGVCWPTMHLRLAITSLLLPLLLHWTHQVAPL
jgi:hypothetical protein